MDNSNFESTISLITSGAINIIFIGIVSFLCYYTGTFVTKYTKVAAPIYYLVLGILFGIGGLALLNENFYIFGNLDIFPQWKLYQTYALYLLFFGSGFSIQLEQLKKNGKSAGLLMIVPVYFELIIMSVIGFFLLQLVGIKDISFVSFLLIATLFAMASPANVIPITTAHLKEGRTGDKNIGSSLIAASILDNVTPLPIILLILPIIKDGKFEINTFASSIIGFIIFTILSIIIGYITNIILKYVKRISKDKNYTITLLAILSFVIFTIYAVVTQSTAVGSSVFGLFGFAFAMFAGAGLANFDKEGYTAQVGLSVNKLFGFFGLPVIFLGVGAQLDITKLLNLKIIIFAIVFVSFALLAKLAITYFMLTKQKYDNGAKKYAMSAFVPKGVTLLNFSVVLGALGQANLDALLKLMITLGTFGVILTIPIGITLMVNGGKKWLVKG